eukprot:3987493-Prorocentrum_lima.AAC.1
MSIVRPTTPTTDIAAKSSYPLSSKHPRDKLPEVPAGAAGAVEHAASKLSTAEGCASSGAAKGGLGQL